MNCEAPVIMNSEIIAKCNKEKGHRGKHIATFSDGSTIKWNKQGEVD